MLFTRQNKPFFSLCNYDKMLMNILLVSKHSIIIFFLENRKKKCQRKLFFNLILGNKRLLLWKISNSFVVKSSRVHVKSWMLSSVERVASGRSPVDDGEQVVGGSTFGGRQEDAVVLRMRFVARCHQVCLDTISI